MRVGRYGVVIVGKMHRPKAEQRPFQNHLQCLQPEHLPQGERGVQALGYMCGDFDIQPRGDNRQQYQVNQQTEYRRAQLQQAPAPAGGT
ncbi:hypothetical protein D3C85_1074930 [compost metagenome]